MKSTTKQLLLEPSFQVAFEVLQREMLKQPNGQEQYNLVHDRLFALLMDGVEELSKEVEIMIQNPESIDQEVRDRFNPCTYLAQYLMRNNPKNY